MEASWEARLRSVEERLERIERVLDVATAPKPAPPRTPPEEVAPPPPLPSESAMPPPLRERHREAPSFEELFGGRVLAWLGGIAVVLGVVFFLVMAVSRGWIDKPTRVVLAFLGSSSMLGAALWLYERKGRTDASLALAAAAIAALYASLTVGTVVYDLMPAAAGFAVAGLVGAVAAAIAVRWSSQVVGGIGILGALLAPVLVDAGSSTSSLVFMAIALVAVVAVLVWQRWPWLAFGSFLVSSPQLLAWVGHERNRGGWLVPILGVLLLFWILYVLAALAHELRVPTEKLRVSSALLLFANVLLITSAGYGVLHDAGRTLEATAWVLTLAAVHVALGFATMRGRISRQIGALLVALGTALSAIGLALALSGPALVAGWAVEAVLLAWLARTTNDQRASVGAVLFLGLAGVHVLTFEAPPSALANGLEHVARGLIGIAMLAIAASVSSRLVVGRLLPWRETLEVTAGVAAVYLGSVAIVDAATSRQSGQLLLSAFWGVTGLVALVAGLLRERHRLRLGGLGLLGVAVGKLFLVDLATLQSIYRVGSFIAVGLLLIAGAFAYQRVRRGVER